MDTERKPPLFFDISTREKIFNAAVKLYSEKGYAEVTMRDIAEAVGVQVAAIYRHYQSKDALLGFLYEFYTAHWDSVAPRLDELLELCETLTLHEFFARLDFRFDPELQDTMDRIIKIAVRQLNVDSRSVEFVKRHSYQPEFWIKILERMIELGKIEPMDVNTFANVITNYIVSTALLNNTPLETDLKTFQSAFMMIATLIKEKPPKSKK